MFDKAKNLYNLQKQAKAIKKELQNIHIEAEADSIIVTINGEQEVVSVVIPDEMLANAAANGKKIQESLVKAFNKAIKKSQQIAADKMKGVMGGMGMGDLLGS